MLLAAPYSIAWNYTDKCNFECRHCYSRKENQIKEMSLKEKFKAADHIIKSKVFFVFIGGGEPLISNDIFDIISYLTKSNVQVCLSSSGYFIDKSTARELKKTKVKMINISLDHTNEQTHDKIRQEKGAFEKALSAIELLKNEQIKICLSTVVSKFNLSNFESIVDLALSIGVDTINAKSFRPIGNGALFENEFILESEQIDEFYHNVATNKFGNKINILTERCPCNKNGLAILSNGDLKMCVYKDEVLGNILMDNLSSIWKSHPYLLKNRLECTGCI